MLISDVKGQYIMYESLKNRPQLVDRQAILQLLYSKSQLGAVHRIPEDLNLKNNLRTSSVIPHT